MSASVRSYIRSTGMGAAVPNMVINPAIAWLLNRQMEFVPLTGDGGMIVDTAITSVVSDADREALYRVGDTSRYRSRPHRGLRGLTSRWRPALVAASPGVGSRVDNWSGSGPVHHSAHFRSIQSAWCCRALRSRDLHCSRRCIRPYLLFWWPAGWFCVN